MGHRRGYSSALRSPPGRPLKPQTQSPEAWAKTPSCLTAWWWSDSMKYRASLSQIISDSLPRGFRASGSRPKFCMVRKYEIRGVTLANCFETLCLVGSMSRELSLNSAWSQDMKYRVSLSLIPCYSLPCGFSVSRALPKFCVVRKYEIQGVTLAIFFF